MSRSNLFAQHKQQHRVSERTNIHLIERVAKFGGFIKICRSPKIPTELKRWRPNFYSVTMTEIGMENLQHAIENPISASQLYIIP